MRKAVENVLDYIKRNVGEMIRAFCSFVVFALLLIDSVISLSGKE